MKKIYLAAIAVAVATAVASGIIFLQNGIPLHGSTTATLAQNHLSKTNQNMITQNSKTVDDGSDNFGPPDDGGYGEGDQLLG